MESKRTTIDVDHITREAIICSCYSPLLRQLYRMIHNYPDKVRFIDKEKDTVIVSVPLNWISIKLPKRS